MVGDFGIRTYHQGSAVLCLFTTMRLNLTGSPDHLRLMQEEHEHRTTRVSERRIDGTIGRCVVGLLKASRLCYVVLSMKIKYLFYCYFAKHNQVLSQVTKN